MNGAATSTVPLADPPPDMGVREVERGLGLLQLMATGTPLAALRGISLQRVEACYALGCTCFRAGRLPDAERFFRFAVMHDHLDRRYHLALGMALHAQGKHEQALQPYGVAVLTDLTDPQPLVRIAECLLALRRKPEALQALEQASGQIEARPHMYPKMQQKVQAMLELIEGAAETLRERESS